MKEPLQEGLDYYIDVQGRWVFTQYYLLKRGYCCQNGCQNCPYGFVKSTLPAILTKKLPRKKNNNHSGQQ